MDSSSIGQRVRRARERRGWSQLQLADRAGVSRALVSRLEAGKRHPKTSSLLAVADALGVTLRDLTEPPLDPGVNPIRRALEEVYGGHQAPFLDEILRELASVPPDDAAVMVDVLRALKKRRPAATGSPAR